MVEPPIKGALYSRLYFERGKPLPDSDRFRVRVANYFSNYLAGHNKELVRIIPSELGVEVPWVSGGQYVSLFFKGANIRDVLSAITLVYRQLLTHNYTTGQALPTISSNSWMHFIQRVFQEENLAYTLDVEAGVHPLVDGEFSVNVATAIASLGAGRYNAVRAAFDAGKQKLEGTPPDLKGAIRDTFEAMETLTKLISQSGKSLDAGFVKAELEPRIQKLYNGDAVAQRSSARSAQSFADWVDAAHPYRHGHKAEEPVGPPPELAILLISQGASFIRWLVDLEQRMNSVGG